MKATGLFGLRKVGCGKLPGLPLGRRAGSPLGKKEGLLPCRAEQAASQLSTEASDKREQVAAVGLVM